MVRGRDGSDTPSKMLFTEKKINNGFEYWTEDVFGVVKLESSARLGKEELDLIISFLSKCKDHSQTIQGEVALKDSRISYEFIKRPIWNDDDDEEEQVEEEHKASLIVRVARFMKAFVQAWKTARSSMGEKKIKPWQK